jgi:hypothetical protein
MRNVLKITLLFFLLFSTTSCWLDNFGIQGNRNVVSEHRKISSDFDAISVSQGITLYLTQGSDIDLTVEADENIIDLLVTEIEGDVLKIYFEKNVNRAKAKKVYLTVDKINQIKTTSGSHVKCDGIFKSKSIRLESTSGSEIKFNADAVNVECITSSGAHMTVEGTTHSFKGKASSGSHIKAYDLESDISQANVSSGAGINLTAREELSASASSGGYINYRGQPRVVNQSKSSGGSISKH